MSETLAKLEKKGGGNSGTDLSLPPDIEWHTTSIANGTTHNIAVTQKPKYIIIALGPTSSASGSTMIGIYNAETDTAYRYASWGAPLAWHNEVWTVWNNYITSVTSSNVTVKNGWGGTVAMAVGIYY